MAGVAISEANRISNRDVAIVATAQTLGARTTYAEAPKDGR